MAQSEVEDIRKEGDMTTVGTDIPKPVRSFEEASFPEYVLKEVDKLGFKSPTPIQKQVCLLNISVYIQSMFSVKISRSH